MKKNNVLRLTESAIMIAFATVLSTIKLIDMPFGGSVTLCSMLPIAFIAYRYGFSWGAFSSVVYSLLQLLLGAGNLSYATSAFAVVMIVLFDYVLPFTGYSIAGLFTKSKQNQTASFAIAILLSGVFRYLCHTLVGYVVWRDISVPAVDAWIYSIAYNAVYMIPEIITTLIAGICLSKILNFRSDKITAVHKDGEKVEALPMVLSVLSKLVAAVGAIWGAVLVFSKLQNESGAFDISGISNVNWMYVAIVLLAAAALSVVLMMSKKMLAKKN